MLKLLNTLGEEQEVMQALRIGTLGTRAAALISVVFSSLYGEESTAFAVADPRAWGFDKVCGVLLYVYRCLCVCLGVRLGGDTDVGICARVM